MPIHEQHTFDGVIEVTDSITLDIIARRVVFTCEHSCRLCGEHFMEGEEIEATFPASLDLGNACQADGEGPWYPGGLTSRWVRHHATEIREMSRNNIIFKTMEAITV